jgi:hypothetical protein
VFSWGFRTAALHGHDYLDADANDPWMMTWNLFGFVESSSVDQVTRRIQINFADVDAHPRIRLTDRLGFNKASLGKFSVTTFDYYLFPTSFFVLFYLSLLCSLFLLIYITSSSLNIQALFSSPRKNESIPATIFYKNFESWAANSDWR